MPGLLPSNRLAKPGREGLVPARGCAGAVEGTVNCPSEMTDNCYQTYRLTFDAWKQGNGSCSQCGNMPTVYDVDFVEQQGNFCYWGLDISPPIEHCPEDVADEIVVVMLRLGYDIATGGAKVMAVVSASGNTSSLPSIAGGMGVDVGTAVISDCISEHYVSSGYTSAPIPSQCWCDGVTITPLTP